jgi:hypothetical protein
MAGCVQMHPALALHPPRGVKILLGFLDWRVGNSRLPCQHGYSPELAGLSVTIAPED